MADCVRGEGVGPADDIRGENLSLFGILWPPGTSKLLPPPLPLSPNCMIYYMNMWDIITCSIMQTWIACTCTWMYEYVDLVYEHIYTYIYVCFPRYLLFADDFQLPTICRGGSFLLRGAKTHLNQTRKYAKPLSKIVSTTIPHIGRFNSYDNWYPTLCRCWLNYGIENEKMMLTVINCVSVAAYEYNFGLDLHVSHACRTNYCNRICGNNRKMDENVFFFHFPCIWISQILFD